MGAASRGGGCVGKGPKNTTLSSPSNKVEVVMAADGGAINAHKKMAMGMMGGGMARPYKKGGMAKKVKKFRKGGSCG